MVEDEMMGVFGRTGEMSEDGHGTGMRWGGVFLGYINESLD